MDGNRVYIHGVEGMLTCVSADKGEKIWQVNTFKDFGVVQNFFGVGSAPVIEGDLLLAMVGGSPPESQRIPPGQLDRVDGNGCGVVAFDKRTGKVRYKITDELASYAGPTLAKIGDRDWCFVFARGGLVGWGKLERTASASVPPARNLRPAASPPAPVPEFLPK